MKWITTDYKGNKKVWYSEDVIKKIIPILELYANSYYDFNSFVHKDNPNLRLIYNAMPAKTALDFLNEEDE